MALPAKVKTWQLSSNLNPGFPGTDANCVGALFVLVKNAMKAFGTNPWTCAGSSDSVAAGMDAVDRITDFTKVVRPGGVHSWWVGDQSQINGGCQLLFDWNSSDPEEVYIFMSPSAGFTGGSTATRPTATDEVGISISGADRLNFVSVSQIGTQGTSVRAHVMMSTDGKSTRIICCQGNVARTLIAVDVPINPPTGWTDPVVLTTIGNLGAPGAPPQDSLSFYTVLNSYDYIIGKGPISTMKMNATVRGFATVGTSDGTAVGYTPWPNANELSSSTEYPLTGVGMMHGTHGGASVVGQRGRHGWFADLYMTALSIPTGKSFPGDGSKSWVVFGNMVFPWNGGDVEIG